MKPVGRFLAVYLPVALFQAWLFGHRDLPDMAVWVETAGRFAARDPSVLSLMTYGYPGTPLLLVASIVRAVTGLAMSQAFPAALALITAAAVTGTVFVARALVPSTPWWVAVAGISAVNSLYLGGPPPTIPMLPLTALMWLVAWQFDRAPARATAAWLGLVIGASAAIRIDTAAVTALFVVVALAPRLTRAALFTMVGTALISFIALDPYLWLMPLQHARDIVNKFLFHYAQYTTGRQVEFTYLLGRSPWAWLGFSLGLAALHPGFPGRPAIPPRMLGAWLLYTVAVFSVLWSSAYRAPWYFYPLLFWWELLLPLFVLSWSRHGRVPGLALAVVFVVVYVVSMVAYLVG